MAAHLLHCVSEEQNAGICHAVRHKLQQAHRGVAFSVHGMHISARMTRLQARRLIHQDGHDISELHVRASILGWDTCGHMQRSA